MSCSDSASWKSFFDDMDKDKNGTIDKGEIKALFLKCGLDEATAAETEKDIMVECDKNMDGKISWAEFEKAMEKASQQAQ